MSIRQVDVHNARGEPATCCRCALVARSARLHRQLTTCSKIGKAPTGGKPAHSAHRTLGRTCFGQPPNCPRPRKPRRGQKASLSNGRSRRTSGAAISSKDERDRSLQHKQPRVTLVRVRSTITFGLISPSRSSSPSRRRATSNSGLSHRPLPFSMCRTTPRPAAQ